MVGAIGASFLFNTAPAAGAQTRRETLEPASGARSVTDEIREAGGFYAWQKEVKREKLEALVRQQVEAEYADKGLGPDELASRIADEVARRVREAIEREAKAEAQSGQAKGVIIDIAV